ncbi:uncharacterized protein LOC130897619 isoform X2 [Diorhabda carinulata]|nr:uncharacterized protein LOC130441566 [Diorhabda sublineata]XP_057662538.1 uncharacterized protein LOC130897619 isoform X2 [Diorhabda carinulata]
MDFAFDSKCNLVLSGCVEMTKTLKTSKATYELTKSPMPTMTGDVDLCSLFGNKKKLFVTKQVFEAYGLPKSCPVPAKKYCVNGKQLISIDSYKNKLGMALGSVVTKLNVDHEDAGKTCVDIKMTVSKKK